MSRRSPAACIVAALLVALPVPALAAPRTTVTLTIQDTDDDRLLEHAPGEPYIVIGREQGFRPPATARSSTSSKYRTSRWSTRNPPAGSSSWTPLSRATPSGPSAPPTFSQEALTTQITEAMMSAAANTTSPVTSERLELGGFEWAQRRVPSHCQGGASAKAPGFDQRPLARAQRIRHIRL